MFDKSPLATGLTLQNRYQVVKQLGRGGFGRTYLVLDRHLGGEYCVLKEFAPQVEGQNELKKARELFNREAGVLYQLQHPQIPRFRELLTVPIQGIECLFLVQDYVEGETYLEILNRYQKKGQVFSEAEVFDLLMKILPVLDYIHAQKVIHRDISPDNLIQRASDKLPVLIDFGGVKQAAVEAVSLFNPRRSLTRIGKPDYAPEEQLRKGHAEPSSDLYALGVTALVFLTGKEPQELYDARNATWQWRSQVNINRSFATILERMVAYLPRDRYQSATELLQALQKNSPQVSRFPTLNFFSKPVPDLQTNGGDTLIIQQPVKHPLPTTLLWLGIIGVLSGGAWGLWQNGLLPIPKDFSIFGRTEPKTTQKEDIARSNVSKRRKALKISENTFNRQVDSLFYARHPALKQRPLTNKAEDAKFREEWYLIADKLLDKLEKQQKK
ncbi:serine/threonine-protein kinase [Merismopedia glauca]|uniref:non-specific serine/threonine protein kinase n=1 Tax=Merismopedia glauca CCAP 1448/3 TaxID=1296344 RepID=A0A2T1C3U1_9CYAN|nr:serine/threonine-protein kinase [Merismopedia glauca]PSB02919.1 serine/threonine protein kinase [Merismopedia glauca CCAP 1448/3]